MVDAWRFTHGDTNYAHQTSGYALALEANLDLFETGISRPEGTVAGGEVCRAVTSARNAFRGTEHRNRSLWTPSGHRQNPATLLPSPRLFGHRTKTPSHHPPLPVFG
jgi:hypothetical protein